MRRLSLMMTGLTLGGLLCATSSARADMVERKGKVEAIQTNLISLKSVNALGLESTIVLRFDPAREESKLIATGHEIQVTFDEMTRTVNRIARPDDKLVPESRNREVQPSETPKEIEPNTGSGETWVLLIGIEKYERLDVLKYPAEDAEALEQIYTRHGGVNPSRILKITDGSGNRPTSAQLPLQIRSFLRRPAKADSVVVFFSGHGVLDTASGIGYLAPSDCDPSALAKTGLAIDDLLGWLGDCSASNKILMLDACHSGAFNGSQLKKALGDTPGVVTLASSKNEQNSIEDDTTRHGMFTNWLIDGLTGSADSNRDGKVTSLELAQWLDKASGGQTKQNPTHNHPPNIGQPIAIRLHGTARLLSFAERRGEDQAFETAVKTLLEMPNSDDLNMEFRRLVLLNRYSKGASDLYIKMSANESAKLNSDDLRDAHQRSRAISAYLMQAASTLKTGPVDQKELTAFRSNIKKAIELIPGIESMRLRVEAVIAIAETMQLERVHLRNAEEREQSKSSLELLLTSLSEQLFTMQDRQEQFLLLAKMAGAGRRLNLKSVFERYTNWLQGVNVYQQAIYNTIERSQVYALALAEGGDIAGANVALTSMESAGADFAVSAQTEALVAVAAIDLGELTSFDASRLKAEKSIKMDAPNYAYTKGAIATLATGLARAGEIKDAEAWLAKLPADFSGIGAVRAEICSAKARRALFTEAREMLQTVPQNRQRLEACHLIAKAEMIAASDRASDLLNWISSLPTPLDRAAAYCGLVDGLEKKPWNRLAMAWDDDYLKHMQNILIKEGVSGRDGMAVPTSDRYQGRAGNVEYAMLDRRPANDVASILTEVDKVYAVASMIQNFSSGNVEGGVGGVISLLAPNLQIPTGIPSVPNPGSIGGIPGVPSIPSIPYVGRFLR